MLGKPSKAGETLQRLGEPFKDRMKTSKAGGERFKGWENPLRAEGTLQRSEEAFKGWGNPSKAGGTLQRL